MFREPTADECHLGTLTASVGHVSSPRRGIWNRAEQDRLIELREQGKTIRQIAADLNRTFYSVRCKIGALGLPPRALNEKIFAEENEAIAELWREGMTTSAIGRRLNLTGEVVKKRIDALQLHEEPRAASVLGSPHRLRRDGNYRRWRVRNHSSLGLRQDPPQAECLCPRGHCDGHARSRMGYPAIGKRLGGRDHSTIIYLCQNFDVFCRLSDLPQRAYDAIKQAERLASP